MNKENTKNLQKEAAYYVENKQLFANALAYYIQDTIGLVNEENYTVAEGEKYILESMDLFFKEKNKKMKKMKKNEFAALIAEAVQEKIEEDKNGKTYNKEEGQKFFRELLDIYRPSKKNKK